MTVHNPNDWRRRNGLTLIELLVVIGIVVTIAALTVLLGPALLKQDRAATGASRLQGTLFIAKQQALRDRSPYGVRLIKDNPNDPASPVRALQYIRRPDNFSGGQVEVVLDPMSNVYSRVNYTGVDPTGGFTNAADYPVLPGDYIQIGGQSEPLKQITGVTKTGPTQGYFTVAVAYGSAISPTSTYQIIRGPRPVPGEEAIALPDDVIIDFTVVGTQPRSRMTADVLNLTPPVSNYDILFSPSGQVLGPAGADGKIILWVREDSPEGLNSDQQSLIVIFTRSGMIAAYPVDLSGTDPYAFTRDPRATGL